MAKINGDVRVFLVTIGSAVALVGAGVVGHFVPPRATRVVVQPSPYPSAYASPYPSPYASPYPSPYASPYAVVSYAPAAAPQPVVTHETQLEAEARCQHLADEAWPPYVPRPGQDQTSADLAAGYESAQNSSARTSCLRSAGF